MEFTFDHNNINVFDLEKSIMFYKKALGLKEEKRYTHPEGDFILVFLQDDETDYQLELTWLRDRKEPYNLGDNEFHLALTVDNFKGAYAFHKNMGCVCCENLAMGIYFISDPDGYWVEILPQK